MFYKKKKIMSEQSFDDTTKLNEDADNMAQNNEDLADIFDDAQDVTAEEYTETPSEEEKLKAELAEAKDKYLRMAAEFDNFRRRTAKERIELTQTAGKDIIQSLLTVLDDSERAAKQIETAKDIDAIKEGLSLVFNKLHAVLQARGLKAMESANQPFDPELHEAITEIPAPNNKMIGKVMDVIEPGYYLNDKLIRHAKVVVGK
jgi:molecular chaperone GrpE